MRFIKLSNRVINTNLISSINMYDKKYIINILHYDIFGMAIAMSGTISSNENKIEVTKKEDIDVITNWIDKNTKN